MRITGAMCIPVGVAVEDKGLRQALSHDNGGESKSEGNQGEAVLHAACGEVD